MREFIGSGSQKPVTFQVTETEISLWMVSIVPYERFQPFDTSYFHPQGCGGSAMSPGYSLPFAEKIAMPLHNRSTGLPFLRSPKVWPKPSSLT